jgi:hypothetical protein
MSAGQSLESPVDGIPPALRERARGIVGRQWVADQVREWLETGSERYFLLTGEPGSGKSTLAAWLAGPSETDDDATLTAIRGAWAARHFCMRRGGGGSVDPRRFTELIARQLAAAYDDFALAVAPGLQSQYNIRLDVRENWGTAVGVQVQNLFVTGATVSDAFSTAVSRPLRLITEARPGRGVFIIVDGLDEALMPTLPNIVTLLAGDGDLPDGVRLLLTSRNERRVLDLFAGRPEGCRRLDLSAPGATEHNRADLRAYVTGRIAREAALRALDPVDIGRAAAEIATRSAGNFLYTTMLLDEVAEGRRELTDVSGLPTGLFALYRAYLLRLIPESEQLGGSDAWLGHYRPLLGALSVAVAPVPADVLAAWTGRDRGEIVARLDDLQQVVRYDRESGGHQLYHASMADFLGTRHADDGTESLFFIPPDEQHQRIVDHYLGRVGRPGWASCDSYGLAQLPQHLAAWIRAAPDAAERSARAGRLYRLVADPGYIAAQADRFGTMRATTAAFRAALDAAGAADDTAAAGRLIDLLALSPHAELRGVAVEGLVALHSGAPQYATGKILQLLGGKSPDGWSVGVKAAHHIGPAAGHIFRWIALKGSAELRRSAVCALYLRWGPEPGNFTSELLDDLSRQVRLARPLRSRRILEFLADLSITVYINHCDDPAVTRHTSDLWHRVLVRRLHLPALSHPRLDRLLGNALSRMFGKRILEGALSSEFQDPHLFFRAPADAKALFRSMIPCVDPGTDITERLDGIAELFRSDITMLRNLAQVIVAVHCCAHPERTGPLVTDLAAGLDPAPRLWLLLSFSVLLPDTPPGWTALLEDLTTGLYAAGLDRVGAEAGLPPALNLPLLPLGLAYGKAGGLMPRFSSWLQEALDDGDFERVGRLVAWYAPVGIHYPHAVFRVLRDTGVPLTDSRIRAEVVAALAMIRTLHVDQVDDFLTRSGADQLIPDVGVLSDIELMRRHIALVGYYNNVVHQAIHYPRMRYELLIPCFTALADADGPADFIRRFTPVPLSMLRDADWELIQWTLPLFPPLPL